MRAGPGFTHRRVSRPSTGPTPQQVPHKCSMNEGTILSSLGEGRGFLLLPVAGGSPGEARA